MKAKRVLEPAAEENDATIETPAPVFAVVERAPLAVSGLAPEPEAPERPLAMIFGANSSASQSFDNT